MIYIVLFNIFIYTTCFLISYIPSESKWFYRNHIKYLKGYSLHMKIIGFSIPSSVMMEEGELFGVISVLRRAPLKNRFAYLVSNNLDSPSTREIIQGFILHVATIVPLLVLTLVNMFLFRKEKPDANNLEKIYR